VTSRIQRKDRQCTYKRDTDGNAFTHCCSGKAIPTAYSECAFIFLPYLSDMQSACAVFYWHLWPVWMYHTFAHYVIKGKICGKTLLSKKCVFLLSLQLLSKKALILRRVQRDIMNKFV
jgi:hypothetical protein